MSPAALGIAKEEGTQRSASFLSGQFCACEFRCTGAATVWVRVVDATCGVSAFSDARIDARALFETGT